MKKFFKHLVVFTVALSSVACMQNDDELDTSFAQKITSVQATIVDDECRTTATLNSDGSIQMLWSADDVIKVTDLTNSGDFKIKSGVKTKVGTFAGSIATLSESLYGVYPASSATVESGKVYATIPSVQTYTDEETVNVEDRNLMIGHSTDASAFTFATVGAMARFNITVNADETISSVKMYCEDGYLSGKGEANLTDFSLGTLNSKEVTLNYSTPSKGTSNGGWALIAPLDFTKLSGEVYYDVTTDKGTYTFCRKPSKAFKQGYIYTFPLSISTFEQVSSKSALTDGKYYFESNSSKLTVRTLRITDTTIAIGWSSHGFPENYSADAADIHELYLYDENLQLLVAWRPNDAQLVTGTNIFPYSDTAKTTPPRFIFTGLTPNTAYNIQVKNTATNDVSPIMKVATIPTDCSEIVSVAKVQGDALVFQNFGKLVWNGDITTLSAGYVHSSYSSVSDINHATAWGDYRSASQTEYKYTRQDREQNLFTTYSKFMESANLSDWGYWRNSSDDATSAGVSAVLARPSYLKVGVTKVRAGIATPELSALLGSATVRVTFKAASYGTTSFADHKEIAVTAGDQCSKASDYRVKFNKQVAKKQIVLPADGEWREYSVELSGVTATSRIIIHSDAASVSSANNRFLIDDIKVELVKYDGDVDTDVITVKAHSASAHSVTIEWDEVATQSTRAYTVSLYSDSACANLHQSYKVTLGNSNYVGKWPARFTFPFLDASKNYYATVTDASGNISQPAVVRTADIHSSTMNEVLHMDFDWLCWGGDFMNMAYAPTLNVNSTKTYNPGTLINSITDCKVAAPTAAGAYLSAYSESVNSLFSTVDWESSVAAVMQGYVKLGTASSMGKIATPALSALASSNSKITVSFKACQFTTSSSTPQTSYVYVNLLDEAMAVKESKKIEIGNLRNIPAWDTFSTTFSNVSSNDRVQFTSGETTNSMFCLDDVNITSDQAATGTFGYVTDTAGAPIAGVVVSDGYSAVKTNAEGFYTIKPHRDCWYIYISIPADCEVPINSYGQPAFFQKYTPSNNRYDFKLTKLAGGAEKEFALFGLADTQCKNSTHRSRFKAESVPAIKAHVESQSLPCYGITLGDVVYSEGSANCDSQMAYMRSYMAKTSIGMPVFQVMGNHDYTWFYSSKPIAADETSSTYNIKAQRQFESIFGPINYSFNRGDAHIIGMRNMQWTSTTAAGNYNMEFTDEQYEWLKQDLSFVPKDKLVIFCVHIPIVNSSSKNVQNVIKLLAQYDEAHILSGHTHYMRNEPTRSSGVYEHVLAAVCGNWWYSKVNGDGCPNGYGVFEISGNT
ncbi:MAG: metallophosphoesterase, partial [Alistipes sp.]|nr:metallophosphoesterase [Alistipes sp.]